ncbi:tankyrase-1-like [Cimex lectularius]|uniref:Uncharacterized protein n=1 Tax=Cimex lectularius TaxID=79782 RepID=A0A8I6RM96_CIMLE|nr:tankyrase-1-like [Cimex lectularius]
MHSENLSPKDKYLLRSVMFNNIEGVVRAIELGADINMVPDDGLTCIHLVAEKGFIELTKLLVSLPGIQLDVLSSFGWSPLSNAVYSNHLEICTILLQSGANPNFRVVFEQTPLHIAVFYKRPIIVAELIKYGADVNSVDCFHQSPLHLAVFSQPSATITKILMDSGADPNFKSKSRLSILTEAVLVAWTPYHTKIISFLINFGADVMATDDIKRETPLHKAALNGYVPALKLLIQHGADINAKNAYNQLPVDLARLHGNHDATEELVLIDDFFTYQELKELMDKVYS